MRGIRATLSILVRPNVVKAEIIDFTLGTKRQKW